MPCLKNDIIMKKEIQQLECLSQISSAIINKPTLSIADFGVGRDNRTNLLTYTGTVDSNVRMQYASIAAASVALTGAGVVATGTALSTIGLVAGATAAGSFAAAGGVSTTGIGLAVAPFILLWGLKKYKEKKREQEQKDRMYREIVAKQQAAINKQKQINRELEEKLRDQKATTEQLKIEVARLKQEIDNLTELIQILTEQINQFKQAA